MKLKISLGALVLCFGLSSGQAAPISDSLHTKLSLELEELKQVVHQQGKRINDYSLDIIKLKRAVVQARGKQDSLLHALKAQAESFMARQSQTEGAIEQAQQELQKGFAQQEKLNSELQAALKEKMSRELWLSLGAFAVLIAVFLGLSQRNLKKGLQQSQSNWNRFQEHFLKTKHHE